MASRVMKMVKVKVSGKVRFITDKGPWYWEVTKANPDLWTHKYERFGKRSLIESVIGIIRHRLRQFNRRRLWYKRRDADFMNGLMPFLLLVQFSFLS